MLLQQSFSNLQLLVRSDYIVQTDNSSERDLWVRALKQNVAIIKNAAELDKRWGKWQEEDSQSQKKLTPDKRLSIMHSHAGSSSSSKHEL